jgi:hypothetical protein
MSKGTRIIILAFVIVVLAATAIPNFLPARVHSAQNACVNNLRLIQIAKERWAQVSPTILHHIVSISGY